MQETAHDSRTVEAVDISDGMGVTSNHERSGSHPTQLQHALKRPQQCRTLALHRLHAEFTIRARRTLPPQRVLRERIRGSKSTPASRQLTSAHLSMHRTHGTRVHKQQLRQAETHTDRKWAPRTATEHPLKIRHTPPQAPVEAGALVPYTPAHGKGKSLAHTEPQIDPTNGAESSQHRPSYSLARRLDLNRDHIPSRENGNTSHSSKMALTFFGAHLEDGVAPNQYQSRKLHAH